MVGYVVEFLPMLVSQLYGANNWRALQERRAAELEERGRLEATLAETVNNLPISAEVDDERNPEAGDPSDG